MRLLYTETNYNISPPEDIPFAIRWGKLDLAICARQGMIDRLAKLGILAIGIWEINEKAFKSIIDISDTIVIVGRDRIHPLFEDKIKHLEEYAASKNNNSQEHSYIC